MPKTTPAPKEQPAKTWDRKEAPKYVRCELTKAQKEQLAAWAQEAEDMDLLAWIDRRVGLGHVMSVKATNSGYQCSLTGDSEVGGHVGISLVSRASTAVRALYACWFKDEIILQGVWPSSGSLDELDY